MNNKMESNKSTSSLLRKFIGIVIVSILVLSCIIFFVGYGKLKKTRELSRSIACVSNLKQIGMANIQYKEKYGSNPFNSATGIHDVLKVLNEAELLPEYALPTLKCGGLHGYDYVLVKDSDPIQPKDPSMPRAILRDPDSNAHSSLGTINVLFEDGHVESLPKSSFH